MRLGAEVFLMISGYFGYKQIPKDIQVVCAQKKEQLASILELSIFFSTPCINSLPVFLFELASVWGAFFSY
jgi:hypothetical protein